MSLCGIYSTLSLNQYNVSIIGGDNTVKERECTCAKEVAFTKPGFMFMKFLAVVIN